MESRYTTIDPEDKWSLEDEKVEGINKFFFSFLPAHLHWALVQENDPDCVMFSWLIPSLEFGLKQSCAEVIPVFPLSGV